MQAGGVVGEARPGRAPLAFAVYSDKTTKTQCVQRVQCPVPTLCRLTAAAGTFACRNLTGGKAWPVYVRLENGLHLGPKSCLHCLVAFIVEPATRSGACRAPRAAAYTAGGVGCSPVPCVGW